MKRRVKGTTKRSSTPLTVCVVTARCQRRPEGHFGVRFEQKESGTWAADWAFATSAQAASREGYRRERVTGRFELADAYPGCPWCEAQGIVECDCGAVCCWDGKNERLVCPSCKRTIVVSGELDGLNAGGDR